MAKPADLTAWMKQNGLTQAQAAERLGVTQPTIGRWLKQEAQHALTANLPLRWFFGGTPSSKHPPVMRLVPWSYERCIQERDALRAERDKHDQPRFDLEHAYDGVLPTDEPEALAKREAALQAYDKAAHERYLAMWPTTSQYDQILQPDGAYKTVSKTLDKPLLED